MKVLVVHNRYRSAYPGGEDRVVDQERAALIKAGHMVERFERCSDEIDGWSVAQKALLPARVVWSERTRRSLLHVLRDLRPDVVHIHNTFPLLSPSVLYACRAEAVPVVLTLHNSALVCASGALFRDGGVCHDCVGRLPLPGVRHGCYRNSVAATVPLATSLMAHRRAWRTMVSAYIFLSAAHRDIVAVDGFPSQRLFVKHNFVPAPQGTQGASDDLVVYAGRLSLPKGVPLLMEAWDLFKTHSPGGALRLALAGAGPLEDDVAMWAAKRPSVDLLGVLSRSDCASLVAKARATVVPSMSEETFGLVVAESMAAGVPPLASSLGSLPELITNGSDGVLFPPGDANALAAIFSSVETQPSYYRKLGEAARGTYLARFSEAASIKDLTEIYSFVVQNPAA